MRPVDDFSRRDFLRCGGAGTVLALTGTAFNAKAAPTLKVGFALVSPAAEAGWVAMVTAALPAIVLIPALLTLYEPQRGAAEIDSRSISTIASLNCAA